MLLLTFVVWVVMYVQRLRFVVQHRIDPQGMTTPEKSAAIIPEPMHWPANNFRNLFELPVVFYVLCLYLFVVAAVDSLYVTCAWLFLGFRIIHSLIHCTVNVVRLRFAAYVLGASVLWFMVMRAAVDFFI